jgi:TatD DNase family protein
MMTVPKEEIFAQALQHQVEEMLCVCTHLKDIPQVLSFTQESNPKVVASIGLHPGEHIEVEPSVEQLSALAEDPRVVALGETGLDFYHTDNPPVEIQKQRFLTHIQVARALKKPLIIHTRAAAQETLEVLRAGHAQEVGGVFHCFTENWETAAAALDLGFYISIAGIITFKNAEMLRDVVKRMPLDRLLIETDAPYLAPVPFRGQSNVPAYVHYVAVAIAALREESLDTIARITTENYRHLFG